MRRRLVVMLVAVAMVLAFAPGVSASYWVKHESSCGQYMVSNSACFKENTDGTGDILLLFQGSVTRIDNLQRIAVPAGTTCSGGGVFNSGSWNDCLSYMYYNLNSGIQICVFSEAFYHTLIFSAIGPTNGTRAHALSGSQSDNTSSISLEGGGGQC